MWTSIMAVALMAFELILGKIIEKKKAKKIFLKFVSSMNDRSLLPAKLSKSYEEQLKDLGS